jgi:hypothetical protein
MDWYAELMQRLLEIQCGGRERSPELMSEDQRLMNSLQQKNPGTEQYRASGQDCSQVSKPGQHDRTPVTTKHEKRLYAHPLFAVSYDSFQGRP